MQAYYAAYGATQALIAAEGHARPTSHPATQTMYVDLWSARGASVPPWTFAIGSKADRRAQPDGTLNGPGRALNAVSGLSSCTAENCWELAAQAVRSTREDDHKAARKRATADEVNQRHRDWNAEETERLARGQKPRRNPIWWDQTPRLSAARRVAIDKRLRPYTVLDYLYRLRLKANYMDARMYTDGPLDQPEAEMMRTDLARLTAATLLVHEVRVAKLLKRDRFLGAVDAWIAKNAPAKSTVGIAGRRDILGQAL